MVVDDVLVREATWMQVNGYSGGVQRGYKTYDEAQAAWVHVLANNVVGPPLCTTSAASVPLPHTLAARPPLIPDVQNVATMHPLPSDHSHERARASTASPSLLLQEPRSPTPRQVLPDAPRQVLQSLPSVSSHERRSIMVSRHVGGFPAITRLSDEEAYWVVIAGASPGVYHGKYLIPLCFLSS